MSRQRAFRSTLILAITLIYFILRLRNLGSCLWFDEIFSVHAAEHAWSSIFTFIAADLIHPPLFYLILKLWISVGGENLLWLRLLPVLFSVLAVVPFLFLCRELKLSFFAKTVALFLISINGSLIKYSQEVRMYSLLLSLSLTSLWLFTRYFNRGKGIVPLAIVNLFLVYTHYFGWFVLGAEVLSILILQR